MEKRKAHYDLEVIKSVVAREGCRVFTYTALRGAAAMGLDEAQMLAVIMALTPAMLYKSMTTHADHRIWQDVYHAPCPGGKTAYIKLTQQADRLVIQFKEK